MVKLNTHLEQSCLKPWHPFDEDFGVFDVVFLLQLTGKQLGRYGRSPGVDSNVKDSVGFRIDGRVESLLLAVDPHNLLNEGNLFW